MKIHYKIRVLDWIEEETGFRLEGSQRRAILLEFPYRLPRKLKKRIKKNRK